MEETRYVSTHNYNLKREAIPAGTKFTEDQWVECGGNAKDLPIHLAKGYITEVAYVKQVPPQPINAPAPPQPINAPASAPAPAPTQPETETVSGEENEEKVIEPEQTATASTKHSGICDFTEELEPLSLPVLNGLYKDHAEKFGLKVRAYKDKEALIKKMTSEQAKD
jgi:hypothetical protein